MAQKIIEAQVRDTRRSGVEAEDLIMDEHIDPHTSSSGGIGAVRVDLPVATILADAAGLPVRLLVDPVRLEAVRTQVEAAPGWVEPIKVWQASTDSGEYHLVSGRHRLEAHRILGRDTIPAVVMTGSLQEIARYAAERIPVGPGSWSPMETAQAHGRARAILGPMSGRKYAEFIGRGRNEISRHLRIFDSFPWDSVMEVLRDADISHSDMAEVTKDRLDDIARRKGTVAERVNGLVAAPPDQSDRLDPDHSGSQGGGTRGHAFPRIGCRGNGSGPRRGRVDWPPQEVRQETEFGGTPEFCDCGVVPSLPEGKCRWSGVALLLGAIVVMLQWLLLGGVGHLPY